MCHPATEIPAITLNPETINEQHPKNRSSSTLEACTVHVTSVCGCPHAVRLSMITVMIYPHRRRHPAAEARRRCFVQLYVSNTIAIQLAVMNAVCEIENHGYSMQNTTTATYL